ncbi:MAG: M64 family metallo-endopeptidase [Bacteroidetes bacterium]|nr:M64 family metallo-endopeptidase [Bacteroidota bacterium]
MKVTKFIFTLTICLFALSCSKTPPPKLEFSTQSISLDPRGSVSTLSIKSNTSWKISTSLPEWLTIRPASGQGEAQLEISGVPNTKYPRTVEILFVGTEQGSNVSATLQITQSTVDFKVDKTALALENDGAAVLLSINTDAVWRVQNIPDWATVTPEAGQGNAVVRIAASVNEAKRERSGSIDFTYFDSQLSLILNQKGDARYNKPPNKPELLYPLDGDTDVSTFPRFAWRCSDPDGDSIAYSLYISTDGFGFAEYGPYADSLVYLNSEFTPSMLYYYKIVADDGDGGVTESDTYSFTTCNRTVYADGTVLPYMRATHPQPVILIFTGDGYIKQECNAGGLFEQNATEGIEALFSIEPYKSYRDYFTVYIVFAHSIESGATQLDQGIYRQTAFGTTFDDSGTHMSTNTDKAFEYARFVPEMTDYGLNNTVIFMMVNQDRYAGTCWMWPGGRSVAICPVSRRSSTYGYANVVLHEGGGHGFGRLADEYVNNNTQIPASEVSSYRSSQDRGMYLNVDFTTDSQKILWAQLLGLPGYNRVGIFEGAALYRYGAFRSEETNCMINNMKYFSAACREQIVKRILTISGEGYSLEKFVGTDYVRSPNAEAEAQTKSFDPKTFIPLAPPVVVW